MELRTRFTDRFGIDVPIVSAPMAGSSDGRLAGAVSAAGALGTFGAVHPERTTQWVREQIDMVRSTSDRPFGVGFLTPFLPYFEDRFDAVIEANAPVVVLSFADPEPWLGRAQAAGARVICQVQTLEQARRADDVGADAIVVQGNEAGGHTGTMGLLPLLAAVLDACPDTPVLAAGGVADGRTLAGVLAAGADGALVGTALLASLESPEQQPVKELIVASDGGDTVWTHAFDIASGVPWPEGIGERVRRNAFTARWEGRDDELRAERAAAPITVGDVETDPNEAEVLYGPAAAFVDGVHPAAVVIERIVDGAARRLRESATRFATG